MLVLMCQAGTNRYAIEAADVLEVVPYVNFNTVTGGPAWLAGAFAHRGRATPLVDFTLLLTGRPGPRRWNSRIILMELDTEGMPPRFGLLAERVTTAEIDAKTATDSSSAMEALGPILLDDRGMFQLVDLSRLLGGERGSGWQPAIAEGTP